MGTLTARPLTGVSERSSLLPRGEVTHRVLLALGALTAAASIVFLAAHGFDYYRLPLEERPFSPLHAQLRSSGTIGLKLGMLSVLLFVCLFLYPLRKRWRWLGTKGSTRRWLNFHILLGLSTPFIVTFHSAFKVRGLAGVAWWTMVSVALSGLIGRYVYAKIPRGMSAVRLTMGELEAQTASLAAGIGAGSHFNDEDLAALLRVPTVKEAREMNLLHALFTMARMDLSRPFLISRLRRRELSGAERVLTLGGLRASHHREREAVLANVQRQARLSTAMAFLDRTERVFHFWHVIHRPFSISFVVLIAIHIGVAVSVGF
jgi:hypothetical protein